MNLTVWVELSYLVSAVLFVVGLKRMQSPATARNGNALAASAMLLAIIATLVDIQVLSWTDILIGVTAGAVIGSLSARLVQMTAMPQMVGIFNGSGGGASAVVAAARIRPHQPGGRGDAGAVRRRDHRDLDADRGGDLIR